MVVQEIIPRRTDLCKCVEDAAMTRGDGSERNAERIDRLLGWVGGKITGLVYKEKTGQLTHNY